jgi:pyridoxal phosphate enzyme (YggS family)
MDIKANIKAVKAALPPQVTLVAVSKMQGPQALQAALDAGQRVFGENRVQEAIEHWEGKRNAYPDLQLHLIGHLQTNKAREAVALFDVIETVDRERLVDALVVEMKKQNKALPCFIQVNTGDEPQKGGVAADAVEALHRYCVGAGLNITGLMCIPPASADPVPHFEMLAGFAKKLGLKQLSMGMSGDYEAAIAAGATHVRIGSALFGARPAV